MKYSFTVFGEDWGRHPSSTQHIFRQMMEEHDVHWINSIGMRSPKLCKKDINRIIEKAKCYFKPAVERLSQQDISPETYQPKLFPFHGVKLIQRMNKKLFKHPKTSVLWTSLPTSVYLHAQLKPECVVYYCGDDFTALEGVDHEMVERHEQDLAEQADIIFTINDDLAKKFPDHKTHILDHGVDYKLFSTPQARPVDLPKSNKIAGFYGSIQSWLDTELIESLAKEMKDWTFVFIGNVHVDVGALHALSNIHFLGPKKHSELPAYVQHWDVSLLPFKRNGQIEACNPLKLKEYMASGCPVVTTKFPAVDMFADLIYVVEHKDEFVKAMNDALIEENDRKSNRKHAMKRHSWEARAQYAQSIIQKHLMA